MASTAGNQQNRRPPAQAFRARARARIAELDLTHDEVAVRLRRAAEMVMGPNHAIGTSTRKVSYVLAGGSYPKLPELPLWALALETNEAYLLGFTWDPRPEVPVPAAIVGGNPGKLKVLRGGLSGSPRPIRSPLLTIARRPE